MCGSLWCPAQGKAEQEGPYRHFACFDWSEGHVDSCWGFSLGFDGVEGERESLRERGGDCLIDEGFRGFDVERSGSEAVVGLERAKDSRPLYEPYSLRPRIEYRR